MAFDQDMVRGQVDSLILRTLLEQDKYGLELYNEIKYLDNLIGSIKQPTFYNALKRLETAQLISSFSGGISNGAKRVYYSVTNKGRAYLQDEYKQWNMGNDEITDMTIDADDDDDSAPLRKRKRRKAVQSINCVMQNVDDSLGNDSVANNVEPITNVGANKSENVFTSNTALADDAPKDINLARGYSTTYQGEQNSDNEKKYRLRRFTMDKTTDDSATISKKKALLDEIFSKYEENAAADNDTADSGADEVICDTPYVSAETYETIVKEKSRLEKLENTMINGSVTSDTAKSNEDIADIDISAQKIETAAPRIRAFQPYVFEPVEVLRDKKIAEFNTNSVDTVAAESIAIAQESNRIEPVVKGYGDSVINTTVVKRLSSYEPNSNVNYINPLSDIYDVKPTNEARIPSISATNAALDAYAYDVDDDDKYKQTSFNKLKQKFSFENVKLKQYVHSNTSSFYVGRYYYSAKLCRDVSYCIYALFLAFCLIVHFAAGAEAGTSVKGLIAAIVVAALIPIALTLYYATFPTRRKYANFNFGFSMIAAVILAIISIVIIVMTAFFGFKINVNDASTVILPLIVPIIAALYIPASVILYGLLYNSKRYHLK